jgi:ribosome-associated protein
MAHEIPIRGDTIRLGQLLKLAGIVDSGSDVKALLADAHVLVNGQPETRRGRQLHVGDVVRVSRPDDDVEGEHELQIVSDS